MRWLSNYFRQVFYKHDYQYDEEFCEVKSDFGGQRRGIKVSLICKKCGYHKSFWKF